MIVRIYSLFLVCCRNSVAPLSFLRMRLLSERKHLSIYDLTARARKNYSCVLGMKISDSDNFLMAESFIWWVVLSDSTNDFHAWKLLMGFQVRITRLDNPPGTNSEGHDHAPRAIFFTLAIYKYAWYSP